MRYLLHLFILTFLLLSAAPLMQMKFAFMPRKRLSGAEARAKSVPFTAESFFGGEFQEKFEKWFAKKFGFRGYLVRTDNQINYSLFREISASSHTRIVLGKDKMLYEYPYITNLNKKDVVSREFLETIVKRIRLVQDYVASRGKLFMVLISPSKAVLYPEHVPARYLESGKKELPSNYQLFMQLLDQYRINYVDGQGHFARLKEESPHLFFATTGAHWNDYASCLISQEIVNYVEDHTGKRLVHFTCGPIKVDHKPRSSDRDLVRLCNLWDETAFYAPTPYPVTKTVRKGGEFRPRVLIVGCSFIWPVLRFLDYHHVYQSRDFFYYYQRNKHFPSRRFKKIDKENMDWEKKIFSQDVIIVEANTATVQTIGSGFLEDAEAVITASQSAKH